MVTAALIVSQTVAADPFVGTWKQNVDKSFNSDPYYAVIRIESAGVNRVKITQEVIRTAADKAAGKKEQSVGEFILDGSEGHPSGMQPGETQSFRRISSHAWERIARRPGDIRHGYWAVSNDGRMLVITSFGKTEAGEYYAQRVLERQ
jgi:hypothetical protein